MLSAVLRALLRPLMFPAYLTRVPRPVPALPGLRRRSLHTQQGPVEWWHLAPDRAQGPAPVVLFAHGNAERAEDWIEPLSRYATLGAHLVLPEYRGYGNSAGTPSEAHLASDLVEIVRTLEGDPKVDARRVVYHGRSIGGGVVCAAARRRPPAGLVLQSTFTSAPALVAERGLPGWLAPERFDNLGCVTQLRDTPVIVVHGRRDRLIPPSHGERLAAAAQDGRLVLFEQADHNTPLHTEPRLWRALEGLLQRLPSAADGPAAPSPGPARRLPRAAPSPMLSPMEEPILTLTEGAVAQIKKIQEDDEELRDQAIRVGISVRRPTGFEYQLEFCEREEKTDDDSCWEQDGIALYVDAKSAPDLRGTSIDYVDQGFTAGFKFDNPNKPALMKDPVAAAVWKVLEEKINPGVAAHGGFVSLLDVKDGTAYVELGGGCQGCGQADVTVKQGVESAIKEEVPEIHTVLDTTDHAAGKNPYFRA